MSIKSKKDALASIVPFTKHSRGVSYEGFFVYIGTEKRTHRKISIWKATRPALEEAIRQFYDSMGVGASPSQALDLSPEDFADFSLARSILARAGHAEVLLSEVARDWVRSHGSVDNARTLDEALREYLSTFPAVQKAHRGCIEMRVGVFVRSIGGARTVSSITAQEVQRFLSGRFGSASPKTYNNSLSYIKSFFNWCAQKPRQFCAENPCADLRGRTIQYSEPEFVLAPTVRRTFALALERGDESERNQWVWQLALSFFAGVRTEEICRLRRCDIDLAHGELRVATPKGFQHGVAPRMVELTDAALSWLRAYPVPTDSSDAPLLPKARNMDGVIAWTKARAAKSGEPLALPHNAGRHSFATMHVALLKDPARTEAMMGTSKSMRIHSYMGLATKAQAEEYFGAVRPESTPAAVAAPLRASAAAS